MAIETTIWTPRDGNGEYTNITPVDIVDPSGVSIVDPNGVQLVSPDVSFSPVASTTWTEIANA